MPRLMRGRKTSPTGRVDTSCVREQVTLLVSRKEVFVAITISKNAHHIATTAFTTASSNYSADIDGSGNEGWIFGKDELDFAILGRDLQITMSGGAGGGSATSIWLSFEVIGNEGVWINPSDFRNKTANSTIWVLVKGAQAPISGGTGNGGIPFAISRLRVHVTGTAATNPQLTVTGMRRGL